jgi:hypothetical protein
VAVPVDGMGTVFVETVKAPLAPAVQKPPRRVGQWFWDRLKAAPMEKVEKPAVLRTRPAGLQQDRLGRARQSAMVMQADRLGVHSRAGLEAAAAN